MPDKIRAPFTPEQVASLNAYQVARLMHPFTCANEGCHGISLIAAEDGWHCARDDCDYRQDWAWTWMANELWREDAPSTTCPYRGPDGPWPGAPRCELDVQTHYHYNERPGKRVETVFYGSPRDEEIKRKERWA